MLDAPFGSGPDPRQVALTIISTSGTVADILENLADLSHRLRRVVPEEPPSWEEDSSVSDATNRPLVMCREIARGEVLNQNLSDQHAVIALLGDLNAIRAHLAGVSDEVTILFQTANYAASEYMSTYSEEAPWIAIGEASDRAHNVCVEHKTQLFQLRAGDLAERLNLAANT